MPALADLIRKVSTDTVTGELEELLVSVGRLEEQLRLANENVAPYADQKTAITERLATLRAKLVAAKGTQPVSRLGTPKPITPPPAKQTPPTGKGQLFAWAAESQAATNHRGKNEDIWLIEPEQNAVGIFDGIGSTSQAAAASHRAATAVAEHFRHLSGLGAEGLPAELGAILESVNHLLRILNRNQPTTAFATTAAITVLNRRGADTFASFALVGDSRLYHWHKQTGVLELVTLDDSLVRLLLLPPERRPGWVGQILAKHKVSHDIVIAPSQLATLAQTVDNHPNPASASPLARLLFEERNLITQSLGLEQIQPHTGSIRVATGDRVVLTTDGIHDNLTADELASVVRTTAMNEVASALVVRAHEVSMSGAPRAKADDMTAVVLEIN